YRIGKAFTRTRNLSFSNLIYFILQSTHKSISINYTQLLEKLSHEKLTKVLSIIRPGRKFGRYRKHTRRRYYTHMKSCL
ncbi:MAG: hypothetical protein IKL51_08390, partial [Lachnospiraceae bacterium]|nr:hypothetical protein [Lachnospiraceae bacterium]